MKSLMDMYDVISKEDKLLLDRLFISLINERNYDRYKKIFTFINNKYNNTHMLSIDRTNEVIMQFDIDKYLTLYFNKYQYCKNKIYSDPITLELLNNPLLYSRYVKPIINMNESSCFNQIKRYGINNNHYPNYNNNYYIKMMMFKFNMIIIKNRKLSIKEIENIVRFFVKKEANDINSHIDFKLIKMTVYFKKLLDKKERGFALQRIMEYDTTNAYHNKFADNFHCILINISNYRSSYFNNEWTFFKILRTIYHECRHAFQSNGQVPILANINEREQVILKNDYKYYRENHHFFEIEIDAEIYGIEKRESIFEYYFPSLKMAFDCTEEKIEFLTNKYQKRFEFETKIDSILMNNPSYICGKYELQQEYFSDGYPKGIMDILKERSNATDINSVIVYNEMIIRSLNRMNNFELTEKILFINETCPFYLQYIEEAVRYKINEMSKVYSIINAFYQKQKINVVKLQEYHNKMSDYWLRIQYYYQQLTAINQMGLAKK